MGHLLKCYSVHGKNLTLRLATVSDADFILSLRLDQNKGKYISPTSKDLKLQQIWIEESLKKDNEVLFVIMDSTDRSIGCIRMYNADLLSYEWGSWLMIDGLNPLFAIESIALLYSYGKFLGFSCARLEVRQENRAVWSFHEKYALARLISTDKVSRLYLMDLSTIDTFLIKHESLLTSPLDVRSIEEF